MTPDQLRTLRRKLGLTQVDLALALRVSPNTVARWEQRKHHVSPVVELALCHLQRTFHEYRSGMTKQAPRLTHPAFGDFPMPKWEEEVITKHLRASRRRAKTTVRKRSA